MEVTPCTDPKKMKPGNVHMPSYGDDMTRDKGIIGSRVNAVYLEELTCPLACKPDTVFQILAQLHAVCAAAGLGVPAGERCNLSLGSEITVILSGSWNGFPGVVGQVSIMRLTEAS